MEFTFYDFRNESIETTVEEVTCSKCYHKFELIVKHDNQTGQTDYPYPECPECWEVYDE